MIYKIIAPNLRCTGQHELVSFWNVISRRNGSRIYKGRIGETQFLVHVGENFHFSRSPQITETEKQAAGELGPLGSNIA